MSASATKHSLGSIFEPLRIRCGGIPTDVYGIDVYHHFIPTRANLSGVDTSKYFVVPKDALAFNLMHIGRDKRIPVAYNDSGADIVVTQAYNVFRIKEDMLNRVLPQFLYLYLCRDESDRYTWFCTDSSIRGNITEQRLLDIEIPLPEMEIQRQVVDVWEGLHAMKQDNEAQAEPLMSLCMCYLEKLRKEYPCKELSTYIERIERFNIDNTFGADRVRGVSNTKEIMLTRANITGRDLSKFLVIKRDEFVFNRRTTRNGERLGLGYNDKDEPLIFTEDYVAFRVRDRRVLLPEFLYLCFKRDEFDRYARYHSWGSATELFGWDDMKRVRIPIPPIEKQRAIVDIYQCARESKEIAAAAGELCRRVTPALIRKAEHARERRSG